MARSTPQETTLLGHPVGLFNLFFAEMWERFSYYGMRSLLVFYMIKGFLGYQDDQAYHVYGAYAALVYATPFLGGILADRLLGARRAVIFGGTLMACGQLLMTQQNVLAFYGALALIIVGNGFFKPNISTIVGSLYPAGSSRRDGGFTIFYMGVNLGAAMSPLICGYVGEHYGYHLGFGLAAVGMMVGLAVFVCPTRLTQVLIGLGALGTAISLYKLPDNVYQLGINCIVALALLISATAALVALERGGVPEDAGAPPDPARFMSKAPLVLVGVVVALPIVALLVQHSKLAGAILNIFGAGALLYLLVEALRSQKVERERLFVVLILMVFSMMFWAFFEQAGSSVNNFTDRNVDRVFEERQVQASEVGQTITIKLNQAQLGYHWVQPNPEAGDQAKGEVFTMATLEKARKDKADTVQWPVTQEHVGMAVGGSEIPASQFQAANPVFIVFLGLMFTALWSFLASRGWEPSTPVKFSMGLLQLGLGFVALWYGATHADARGMVDMHWLLLAYLLHTMGELCLSPVGLSMVTKLSPARMVSTVMGGWFLATAFANYLGGIIATFTSVAKEGGAIPPPIESVGVYAKVFGSIAEVALAVSMVCFMISPILRKWMHVGVVLDAPPSSSPSSPSGTGFTPAPPETEEY